MAEKRKTLQQQTLYSGVKTSDIRDMMQNYTAFSNDNAPARDADGYVISGGTSGSSKMLPNNTAALQQECWEKFLDNPQLNTAIRGVVGRLTGMGFKCTSPIFRIQREIDKTEKDPRNRLWFFYHKFMGRFQIEGELHLSLTLHKDGFVELDFIDPATIPMNCGTNSTGIVFHPNKPTMPLFYFIQRQVADGTLTSDPKNIKLIPSIFIARYPELLKTLKKEPNFDIYIKQAKESSDYGFKELGGFSRFIISNDNGFLTQRTSSHLRTTIKWMNHYEDLKKWEMDLKRSQSAHAWAFNFSDRRLFNEFNKLSEADKAKTPMGQPIKPGQRINLAPGIELKAIAPQLGSISGQDTDILDMITSGLNEAQDITTGRSSGTFASVKATRGPMSDRTSDEVSYFEAWLRNWFWGSIFFLKGAIGKFPKGFDKEVGVGFDKNQEVLVKEQVFPPEDFVKISFPVSENIDYAGRVSAGLGVKHASMNEGLGVSKTKIAAMLGIGDYESERLLKAVEDRKLPKLALTVDQEAIQESLGAEPSAETLVQQEIQNEQTANP